MRDYKAFKSFLLNNKFESHLIVATLIKKEGSSYRSVGAQKIITFKGESIGLISGGCLEGEIIRIALSMKKHTEIHHFDTNGDYDRLLGFATGCQGRLTIEFQKLSYESVLTHVNNFPVDQQLWLNIIGAGPDMEPIYEMLQSFGWHYQFYTSQLSLYQQRIEQGWNIKKLSTENNFNIIYPSRTVFLLMSHNFPTDLEVLKKLVDIVPAYIGILGPQKRKKQMIADLNKLYSLHFSDNDLKNIHGPLGEPGFGKGELAIAMSIFSDLQKRFYGPQN